MMRVQEFYDSATNTLSYIVFDEDSKDAIILDPVLDYDVGSGKTLTPSVEGLIRFVREQRLNVHMILETHAHADHLSGSQELKKFFPAAILAIGSRITEVQKLFKDIYNFGEHFPTDGRQFDRLLQDGEKVRAGQLNFEVMYTPGHTPACSSYLFGEMIFTGDTLFMPDYGTGRCDFPGGSARDLYRSITQKIYKLPAETRIFTCHDYQPKGRPLWFMATVKESLQQNIQLNQDTSEEEFVGFRTTRDKKLEAPRLLHPSVQVNIDAGHLPKPESNGLAYIKIPLNLS